MSEKVKTKNVSTYIKDNMPSTPQEWKKWHKEKKERKRKWKEEKLLKSLEKDRKKQKSDESEKNTDMNDEEKKGRDYTVSIALPGSILDNAQSPELRTYLAGQQELIRDGSIWGPRGPKWDPFLTNFFFRCAAQKEKLNNSEYNKMYVRRIARAAVVFNVDEIVIFDETGSTDRKIDGEFEGVKKKGQANIQMARILQYLECPQYLRKCFFPQHKDLQYAGVLNPLDSPHHMRATDETKYREGIVLNKHAKPGKGSYVNVGLQQKDAQIDRLLQPGLRVTVKIPQYNWSKKVIQGVVVPPSAPCTESGLYWGYTVRIAPTLGTVFTECPYKGGYDLTIGTSERGYPVNQMTPVSSFKHAVVVFGGLKGLEASLEADEALNIDDPRLLFQHYVNTCPNQGSKTIRTEEAILITLSALQPKLQQSNLVNGDS